MYKCSICGNATRFTEHNEICTHILQDDNGEVMGSDDDFLRCAEVVCDECGASSEDGAILNDNGEVINNY